MEALRRLLKKKPETLALLNELIESTVDGTRDIFVNRSVNLDSIKFIGFDMDYTLAIYHKVEIEELAFNLAIEKLIEQRKYPECIRELEYQEGAFIRGLLIDQEKGNLLKIDRYKQVCRVFHGTQPLDRRVYHNDKVNQSERRFESLDTLFSLPEAYLYAKLVDMCDDDLVKERTYEDLYIDVRECIDMTHRDGSLKSIIKKDLARYIYKDPHLALTIAKFVKQGKRLFVLTNSEWTYTNAVMTYLLEGELEEFPHWQDYFEIIMVGAKKPRFFSGNTPFYEVNTEDSSTTEMKTPYFLPDKIYEAGNYTKFEELIDAKGNEVLYIGDHIYGDILRSDKDSNWRTVLVVQELEDELSKTQELYKKNQYLKQLTDERDKLYYELHVFRSQLNSLYELLENPQHDFSEAETGSINGTIDDINLEVSSGQRRIKKYVKEINNLEKEIDQEFHTLWGPLFHERSEISRFGDQVRAYSHLYTSRVSNFFFYPTERYFKSLRDIMPHDRWLNLSK